MPPRLGGLRTGWMQVLVPCALATYVPSCGSAVSAPHAPASRDAVELVAMVDLPREPRTRELSGLAWDESHRRLYAVADHIEHIVPLTPSARFDAWTLGAPIPIALDAPWDGEGLALVEGGFVIANELGPHLYDVDPQGHVRGEIPIPVHCTAAVSNASLESLAVSPDGRYLFTANERALTTDGPGPTRNAGSTVRILRIDRMSGVRREIAYRTDPIFADGGGDIGVADLTAVSDTELLVLERAFVPAVGNQIRIYRANYASAPDVIERTEVGPTDVVKKALVVDLKERFGAGILANYEGMTLGPKAEGGRRVLFLVSDDNGHDEQAARLLTLTIAGDAL